MKKKRKLKSVDNGVISWKAAKSFVEKAHSMYHDAGTLEVDTYLDDNLDQVSVPETLDELKENGGVYVKAWVWVPLEAMSEDELKIIMKGGSK